MIPKDIFVIEPYKGAELWLKTSITGFDFLVTEECDCGCKDPQHINMPLSREDALKIYTALGAHFLGVSNEP